MPTRHIMYDTEFHENGATIDLISIGMVDEEGHEFYAVSSEFDQRAVKAHPWLSHNVWPHLPTYQPVGSAESFLDTRHESVKPREEIRKGVAEFILSGGASPVLWAYFGAYDHVALAQLWGRMIDLPEGIPMYTNDLMTLWNLSAQPPRPAKPRDTHNALVDARWNRSLFLRSIARLHSLYRDEAGVTGVALG